METPQRKLCAQPKPFVQRFDPGVSATRMGYILSNNKKWVNGTLIKYMFIEGDDTQKNVVRKAFSEWKALGIGLSFQEVNDVQVAMVRIGFTFGLGSWSYVGRDALEIPKAERTMNFGWDLTDPYGHTTALHEIGHALAFNHEHQNGNSGIVWNVDAVYHEFSGNPNFWSNDQIEINILSKMPANSVTGSAWDPNSIMHYQFGPGLILSPVPYKNGIFPPGTISPVDIAGVRAFYPPMAPAIPSVEWKSAAPITAGPGGQSDFVFTAPSSKKFTFQTAGQLDTVMVISERVQDKDYYMAGDDDSGMERNAKITVPLVEGRLYVVNVRVMYAEDAQSGSLIVS